MTALRIIGVGSPFGADSVGWAVIEQLESRLSLHSETEFHRLDRPGTALLPLLEGDLRTLVIDAMRAGLSVGTVRHLTLDELESHNPLLSSHGFGVAQTLALGRSLGVIPERLSLVGIEIGPGEEPFGADATASVAETIIREFSLR